MTHPGTSDPVADGAGAESADDRLSLGIRNRREVVDSPDEQVGARGAVTASFSGKESLSVGVVADPGAPYELAQRLERDPPDGLVLTAVRRRLPADEEGRIEHMEIGRLGEGNFDVVVGLTDQVRRTGDGPVVADVSLAERVCLVSLPALGAVRVESRVRRAVQHVVAELSGNAGHADAAMAPFERVVSEGQPADVQFVGRSRHSRLRLLAGMVRANRPLRMVAHLSGAFAAALATTAYVMISPNVWRLADALGPLRLTAAGIFAVIAMVAWLVVEHHMWERPDDPAARRLARLYNATTLLTLIIGVAILYVGLFAIALLAEPIVLDRGLLSQAIGHGVSWRDGVVLAWLASSMGTVAGALGTGFESDDAVRMAAYGYRQRERRRRQDHDAARMDRGS